MKRSWIYSLQALLVSVLLQGGNHSLRAVELYSTDFSSLPFQENMEWAGRDGWLGQNTNNANDDFIIDNSMGGLTGFLGFDNGTNETLIGVYRNFFYDPVAEGNPIVTISTSLGISESTSGSSDTFQLVIFNNTSSEILGSISFDTSTGKILRSDGTNTVDTTVSYPNPGYFSVVITIDFATNVWSLKMNGGTVFSGVTFSDPANMYDLDLGSTDFRWIPTNPAASGDNFLGVDNYTVAANPVFNARPRVKVKKKRQTTSRRRITIRGTATDDQGISKVEYKGGGGRYKKARGKSRWRFPVKLDPGTNRILIRAVDSTGKRSKVVRVKVKRK